MGKLFISLANHEDLPTLSKINHLAYADELVTKFIHNELANEENMSKFFEYRLASRFEQANSQIFKAVDSTDDTIVGFVVWTKERGGKGMPKGPTLTGGILQQRIPPIFNTDFVQTTGAEVEKLKELMVDEEYYYLSAFAVKPDCQGEGVGSRLLEHCLRIADENSLPSWLIALPRSYGLYLRHGFTDVAYKDVDLNKWDKYRFRGYGIYRQYAMVRRLAVGAELKNLAIDQ